MERTCRGGTLGEEVAMWVRRGDRGKGDDVDGGGWGRMWSLLSLPVSLLAQEVPLRSPLPELQ